MANDNKQNPDYCKCEECKFEGCICQIVRCFGECGSFESKDSANTVNPCRVHTFGETVAFDKERLRRLNGQTQGC